MNAFLTHLAVVRNVAASTQNQALCALLFLYDAVLGRPLNQLAVVRARFGTDLGVSTTGFAGPGGGTDANPVGTAYVGRAHAGGCDVVRWGWIGTRYEIMSRTAKLAPNAVRLELMRVRRGEGGRP